MGIEAKDVWTAMAKKDPWHAGIGYTPILPPEKHQHNDDNQHNTEAAADVGTSVISTAANAAEQQDDDK